MTFNQLVQAVTYIEGKKSQVKTGDVREILSILAKIECEYKLHTGSTAGGPLDVIERLAAAHSKRKAAQSKKPQAKTATKKGMKNGSGK